MRDDDMLNNAATADGVELRAKRAKKAIPAVSLEGRVAITVDEFCSVIGFGRNKFYAEVKAGRIKIMKAGKSTLLEAEEPRRYLERLRETGDVAA